MKLTDRIDDEDSSTGSYSAKDEIIHAPMTCIVDSQIEKDEQLRGTCLIFDELARLLKVVAFQIA
jgi:hypothetical protein